MDDPTREDVQKYLEGIAAASGEVPEYCWHPELGCVRIEEAIQWEDNKVKEDG